jgi:tetrahydrodipicolinate N-succinyltransferase
MDRLWVNWDVYWFGCRVGINTIFMPGVKVGSDCFIAAGLNVAEDCPRYLSRLQQQQIKKENMPVWWGSRWV